MNNLKKNNLHLTNSQRIVAGLLFLIFSYSLSADQWKSPQITHYFSSNQRFFFKVVPSEYRLPGWEYRCQGILYETGKGIQNPIRWNGYLENRRAPVDVLVSNTGNYVITFNEWGNRGYGEHTVVIYGPDGKVVKKFSLKNFLTKQEIRNKVPRSVSSINWGYAYFLDPENSILALAFTSQIKKEIQMSLFRFSSSPSFKTIYLDLKTGNFLKPSYFSKEINPQTLLQNLLVLEDPSSQEALLNPSSGPDFVRSISENPEHLSSLFKSFPKALPEFDTASLANQERFISLLIETWQTQPDLMERLLGIFAIIGPKAKNAFPLLLETFQKNYINFSEARNSLFLWALSGISSDFEITVLRAISLKDLEKTQQTISEICIQQLNTPFQNEDSKLIEDLKGNEYLPALLALAELEKKGVEAKSFIPELIKGFDESQDPFFLFLALCDMVKVFPEIIPNLLKTFYQKKDEKSEMILFMLLSELETLTSDTLHFLLEILKGNDPKLSFIVIRLLEESAEENSEILKNLIQLAKEPSTQSKEVLASLVRICKRKNQILPEIQEFFQQSPNQQLTLLSLFAESNIFFEAGVPILMNRLEKDTDPKEQVEAIRLLGKFKANVAVPELIKRIEKESEEIQFAALYALSSMGIWKEAFLPLYEKWLLSIDKKICFQWIGFLDPWIPQNSFLEPLLVKLLKGKVGDVRARTAFILGQMGTQCSEETVSALIELLSDSEYLVQAEAVLALGKIKKQIPNVIASLKKIFPKALSRNREAERTLLSHHILSTLAQFGTEAQHSLPEIQQIPVENTTFSLMVLQFLEEIGLEYTEHSLKYIRFLAQDSNPYIKAKADELLTQFKATQKQDDK